MMPTNLAPDARTAVKNGGVACINGHLLLNATGEATSSLAVMVDTFELVKVMDDDLAVIGSVLLAQYTPRCKCGEVRLIYGLVEAVKP